nr:MAG TPA_asm: hypothetical protein [Caudoviricetes sp.]
MMIPLKIRQTTKKGYIEVYPKGVFDCSYPTSKLRRGRVIQGGGNHPRDYQPMRKRVFSL